MLQSRFSGLLNFLSFLLLTGVLFVATPAQASHIVGGQLGMRAVGDRPGHFTLTLTYYFDETQSFFPSADAPIGIYRKRDNQFIRFEIVFIPNTQRPLLTFINRPCTTQQDLLISVVSYTGDLQLDPAEFDDPAGYYLTYQICCRNGGISNINQPSVAGYVFYAEFPPLLRGGRYVKNSLPVFDPIDSEFICINDPFTFDFDARDPDGDELRYSLVTPLQGFKTATGQDLRPAPYPGVDWVNGFGPDRAIPGNPTLRIDPKTGRLSVTATQSGLFIFAVLVEEFRQGVRLGAVQRDYQFLVVDCPPTIPPNPNVTVNGQPATAVTFCQGRSAQLQARFNPDWNYRWQKDGVSLPGATGASLTVTEPGQYQLITTLKTECSKLRKSEKITVTVTRPTFTLLPLTLPPVCSPARPVSLSAPAGPSLTYQWYGDGQVLTAQQTAVLSTATPGPYWAVLTNQTDGCTSRSDTVDLKAGTLPVVNLTSPGGVTALCAGDSLRLSTTSGVGYVYRWQRDGVGLPGGATPSSVAVRQSGRYQVEVQDSVGCVAVSLPFNLSVTPVVAVALDSVPGQCLTTGMPLTRLRGSPAGGVFGGPGVTGDQFDATRAGPGVHRLTYTRSGSGCGQGQAVRLAVVQPAPVVSLGGTLNLWQGNSVRLPGSQQAGYRYEWSPPLALDDPTKANPTARPEKTTRYTLGVKDPVGCIGTDTLLIRVLSRIWIPDAFSPNGDGLNDVWELRGIEAYPDVRVTVFDRWGSIVFYSEGYRTAFTGWHQSTQLAAGVYTYLIQPGLTEEEYQGRLFILY